MRTEPDLAATNRKNMGKRKSRQEGQRPRVGRGRVDWEPHPGAAGNASHPRMKRPNEPIDASLILASPTEKLEPIRYRVNLYRDFEEYNSHLGNVFGHRSSRPVNQRDGQSDKNT
jgi:hypothetical protein